MTKKFFAAILIATFVFGGGAVEAKSLWVDGGAMSLYADKKARNVGDILTIVINESTTQTATKARTNSKSGSLNVATGTGISILLKHFRQAARITSKQTAPRPTPAASTDR